jgi:hypothetical protein
MTDRNALATSMSRRAGRGGPLDEGRRRGTQDGQAVPLGGHRETLWSWAQAYVEAGGRCNCANPNPNPNPNQVWRRRAWWISSGCRGAGRQPTARRPVSSQPTARRPVAVVEDNADDDDDAGADDDDDDDDADAQQ